MRLDEVFDAAAGRWRAVLSGSMAQANAGVLPQRLRHFCHCAADFARRLGPAAVGGCEPTTGMALLSGT